MLQRTPKLVLSRPQIVDRMRSEILLYGQNGPVPGRKRHGLLGIERGQVDILVGVRLFTALEIESEQSGIEFDTCMEMERTPKGRRLFVASLLARMSEVKPIVVPDLPRQSLYKSLGDLVKTRKTTPGHRGDGGKFSYVAKDTATIMELIAAFNAHKLKVKTAAKRDAQVSDIWAMGLEDFPQGKTLMEAYAEEAAAYNTRVGRGRKH